MNLREMGLSICHPFYNDKPRLEHHIRTWEQYSEEDRKALNFVLVDDGSKEPLITWTDFDQVRISNLHVYQIMQNLKWNTPGALNLCITQAPTEWVIIMDSDCLLLPDDLNRLLDLEPDPEIFWMFRRHRISEDEDRLKAKKNEVLPCSLLMTKTAFHKLGGFDEDFTGERSGGYGFFVSDFPNRAKKYATRDVVPGIIIQEYMEDIVGPNVHTRERVRNKDKINKKIWYAKISGEIPRKRELLRFPWKKVFPV